MSDYISKSEAIHKVTEVELQDGTFAEVKMGIGGLPTLDEKEIIRKTVERIVERLEEYWKSHKALEDYEMFNGTYIEMKQQELVAKAYEKAIKIAKEECGISE